MCLWNTEASTLLKPCGHIKTTVFPNHFHTTHVGCSWWEEEPHPFGLQSKVKVNLDTVSVKHYGHYYTVYSFAQSLPNFKCESFMMKGGILLILDHRVKGQCQLWHFVKTLYAWYRLQFFLVTLKLHIHNVGCSRWEDFKSWGLRSRST